MTKNKADFPVKDNCSIPPKLSSILHVYEPVNSLECHHWPLISFSPIDTDNCITINMTSNKRKTLISKRIRVTTLYDDSLLQVIFSTITAMADIIRLHNFKIYSSDIIFKWYNLGVIQEQS